MMDVLSNISCCRPRRAERALGMAGKKWHHSARRQQRRQGCWVAVGCRMFVSDGMRPIPPWASCILCINNTPNSSMKSSCKQGEERINTIPDKGKRPAVCYAFFLRVFVYVTLFFRPVTTQHDEPAISTYHNTLCVCVCEHEKSGKLNQTQGTHLSFANVTVGNELLCSLTLNL